MPFGLKNASATYQRLVSNMFKEQIGKTMEVYNDDMLMKLVRSEDHLEHIKQIFDIIERYRKKLNVPSESPHACS